MVRPILYYPFFTFRQWCVVKWMAGLAPAQEFLGATRKPHLKNTIPCAKISLGLRHRIHLHCQTKNLERWELKHCLILCMVHSQNYSYFAHTGQNRRCMISRVCQGSDIYDLCIITHPTSPVLKDMPMPLFMQWVKPCPLFTLLHPFLHGENKQW